MKAQLSYPVPYHATYKINNSFALFIQQNINYAKIHMMMNGTLLNTADIPSTFDILKKILPSVLTTECFNEQDIPFYKEVRKTEIGHLFEHILLEYMCQLKIAKGFKSAVYAGRTRWNWKRDPKGLFHIYINCAQKDSDIFPIALKKSILLMKIIFKSRTTNIKPSSSIYLGLKNGLKLKKGKT